MTQVLAHVSAQSSASATSVVATNNRSAAANPVTGFDQLFASMSAQPTVAEGQITELTPKQMQDIQSYIHGLKGGEISIQQLLQGVEDAKALLAELGISGEMLSQMGLTPDVLQEMGVNGDMLKELGLTADQLSELGFSNDALAGLGFSAEEIAQIGHAQPQIATQSMTGHTPLDSQASSGSGASSNVSPAQAVILGYLAAKAAPAAQASEVVPQMPVKGADTIVGNSVQSNGGSAMAGQGGGLPALLASLLENSAEGESGGKSALMQDLARLTKPEMVGQAVNKELFQSVMRRLTGQPERVASQDTLSSMSVGAASSVSALVQTPGQQALSSVTPMQTLNVATHVNQSGWDQAMASRVMFMAQNNLQAAKITLNPQHLGPVEVKLSMQNDQVNVSFVAQSGATRDALEQAMPRLKEMFSSNGLELNNSDVSDGGASQREQMASAQQGDDMSGRSSQGNSSRSAGDDEHGGERIISPSVLSGVKLGLVDFYA